MTWNFLRDSKAVCFLNDISLFWESCYQEKKENLLKIIWELFLQLQFSSFWEDNTKCKEQKYDFIFEVNNVLEKYPNFLFWRTLLVKVPYIE